MNLGVNRKSPGTVSQSELQRLELARDRAKLQIDRARNELLVARMDAEVKQGEVKAAEANIQRRRVLSPLDGFVAKVLREPGEWVDAGQVVMRVIRMDRLHVEGFVGANEFDPSEIGKRPVTVEVELARGRRERLTGQVIFVSPEVQGGVRYRVQAEVANRQENGFWLLRPGMEAAMTVHLNE